MSRVRARVEGTVQGVGFRPYVYRLAGELGVAGHVLNDSQGVVVEVEAPPETVERFLARLPLEAPPLATVERVTAEQLDEIGERGFSIRESAAGGEPRAAVTPDSATCADCLAQLFDPDDRRFRYPFTNCTNCGPRFTIVRDVPYDRPNTTMAAFEMCPACLAEYRDPGDRRFHAQPNACPDCGPRVALVDTDGRPVSGPASRDPIEAAARALLDGAVVAVKGIGGFHLACRADGAAVARLRARKHREDKPFAPIEGLLIEYIGLTGDHNGVDTTVITEIRNYFERSIGEHIPKNYPFVGAEFNTTRAGIHADGILKNEEIYNIFNTQKILNRPLTVAINDKSGTAGIAQWINSYFALVEDERLDKRHPGVAKIYKWVKDEYAQGRSTDISSEEMQKKARKHLPELFISDFDLIKQRAYEMAAHLIEEVVDDPAIRSMDPARQEAILGKVEQENPFIQFLYVTDDKGHKITKNITRPQDRAKYEQIGADVDYSNREWFIEPLKTGKVYVTDFYTSMFTGALCITVAAPIRNKDEAIVGILGMDLRFEELIKAEDLT